MRPLNFGSTMTVRLPDETRALVEAAAEREGASASSWIRRALASIVKPDEPPPPSAPAPAGVGFAAATAAG